jgi:hypothetical protein
VRLRFIPHILAQKDLRRDFFLPVGFFSVTALDRVLPGLALRYEAMPAELSPPESLLPSFLCHAGDAMITAYLVVYRFRRLLRY